MTPSDNHFPLVIADPDLHAFPQLPVGFRQGRDHPAKGAEKLHVTVEVPAGESSGGVEAQPFRWRRLAGISDQYPAQQVFFPGLESHRPHQLAKTQQSGFGGLLSFELKGGKQAGWDLIDATRLVSITANLGDTKTTITHPASTTHNRLTAEQLDQAGISQGLIRVGVGLEDIEDLKNDLSRGLN